MREAQDEVKKFDVDRDWDHYCVKDLLLNMTEEVGEAWNVIKWVDKDTEKRLVAENQDEFEDFVGDALFLILKIANQTGVDCDKAFKRTMQDYYERFPPEKARKAGHANKLAGGVDEKR